MADRNFIRELNYAWAGGFLDGEGCFTLRGFSRDHQAWIRGVNVSAAQVDPAPLQKLAYMFGSQVRFNRITDYGSVCHQWSLGGSEAVKRMIPRVLPYLIVKREQAQIVLAFASLLKRRGQTPIPQEEINKRLELINQLEVIRNG